MVDSKIKISNGVKLFDEAFSPKSTENLHLSIQVGLEGAYISWLDTKANKYLALETYTFQGIDHVDALHLPLEQLFQNQELLRSKYKTVSTAIINPKNTLVPRPLFEEEKATAYLNFNHSLESGDVALYRHFKNMDATIVYAVPASFNNAILKYQSQAKCFHYADTLINAVLLQYKNQPGKKVVVHVQLQHFEVIVLEGKNLILYNSFYHTTAEDFIYYLLFVCEQLKLNPEILDLMLVGEISKNSTIYAIASKYIRNIKFGDKPEGFQYSYKLLELPKHFYYNLYSQYLCE